MTLLFALAAHAAPAAEVVVDDVRIHGTERLVVERGETRLQFDFRGQVHTPLDEGGDPDDVSLRLTAVGASSHVDRVVSAWRVLADRGDQASKSSWIGILEPERARLAGFPVERRVNTVALSGDGEFVAWSDAKGVYVASLEAPPRPKLVLPPDVDPPLFEVEPLLLDDLGMLDLALDFGTPDLSMELFDMIDLVAQIEEDTDEWVEDAPEPPRTRGAQRLNPEIIALPNPFEGATTLVSLSHTGAELASASGAEVALWKAGASEPVWTGTLSERVVGVVWKDDGPHVELAGGDLHAVPRDLTARQ